MSDADVAEAIDIAQAGFVHDLPFGLDTRIGEQGLSLSGGQRQRLALARAVLGRPKVLILDDPLSALDVNTEAMVEQALRRVLGSTTALVVAHRPVDGAAGRPGRAAAGRPDHRRGHPLRAAGAIAGVSQPAGPGRGGRGGGAPSDRRANDVDSVRRLAGPGREQAGRRRHPDRCVARAAQGRPGAAAGPATPSSASAHPADVHRSHPERDHARRAVAGRPGHRRRAARRRERQRPHDRHHRFGPAGQCVDLRCAQPVVPGPDRAAGSAHPVRSASAAVRPPAGPVGVVPREVHLGPGHLAVDLGRRHAERDARSGHGRAHHRGAEHRHDQRRAAAARPGTGRDRGRLVHPAVVPVPLVRDAFGRRVPAHPRGDRRRDRAVRGNDERHPRGAGVPPRAAQRRPCSAS